MLLMHIGVSIERMLHHHYVKLENEPTDLIDSLEFRIAQEFYQESAKIIRIEPQIYETQLLALLLMGKKSNEYTTEQLVINGKTFQISDITKSFLEDIYSTYDVDLRKDVELIHGLGLHMRSLILRMQSGTSMENLYLEEIKRNYPLDFEMSIHACRALSNQIGLQIDENEIGFITLHLGSSYEKIFFSNKYRILLVLPRDLPFSNLCVQKIESRFSERMIVEDQVNIFIEKDVLEMHPDLILTCSPLKHSLSIPTVQISFFIDPEDESKIFQALNQLDKKKNKKQFEMRIKDMIQPDLFFLDLEEDNPETLIRMICSKLEEKDYVDSGYVESVLKREKISSTSFYNGFALPHALNYSAKKSCVSISILKEAMQWNDYSVRLVLLLAINDTDLDLLRIFFDWLSSIVSDSQKLRDLLSVKSYAEFMERIMKG
ncbi:MAG: PTS sugar transporter subunit IIA [Bacillota bacterium]|nr:PTS sugar transporter subunit IIA [Bacillota bacterium]